ncbi:hypothetical protein HY572_02180 [Candidatus Micrarchaeota archaeon]|nr:hypothetical protein [Candidatus Micrarchaeota archaeon]
MEGENRMKKRRGQAALFDGITFLLLASLSAAMIFGFVGTFGVQQDRVMRSAYVLNYMQSVVKASYYVDASTLTRVAEDVNSGNPVYGDLRSPTEGCRALSDYKGSFTVSDLLKRDLSEKTPEKLDDAFDGTPVMGVTAMHCALKELMKPFAFSGFSYGFDVLRSGLAVQTEAKPGSRPFRRLVTNEPAFLNSGVGQTGVCLSAQNPQISSDVLAVRVPFKVVYVDGSQEPPARELREYELALCIWTPQTAASP